MECRAGICVQKTALRPGDRREGEPRHICLSKKRRIGWQGYQREELRVRLPVDRDIAIGEGPNVDEQSIYSIDLREGRKRESSPVREPANPAIQQGFARVLKDAVRDLVAVI